jgi:hypothetical protein
LLLSLLNNVCLCCRLMVVEYELIIMLKLMRVNAVSHLGSGRHRAAAVEDARGDVARFGDAEDGMDACRTHSSRSLSLYRLASHSSSSSEYPSSSSGSSRFTCREDVFLCAVLCADPPLSSSSSSCFTFCHGLVQRRNCTNQIRINMRRDVCFRCATALTMRCDGGMCACVLFPNRRCDRRSDRSRAECRDGCAEVE